MDDISDTTNNIQVNSVNNGSDDSNPSVQIAGSHALCVFINVVSMVWVIVFSWMIIIILYLFDYCLWRKVGPERVKTESYRRFLKTRKIITQVWSVINFLILWSNLSFIIYCYTPHNSCVLYHKDDSSKTNAASMLIVCAICTYVAQFLEGMYHFYQHKRIPEALLTSLHEKISHLISTEKPVVRWTAMCFHNEGDDRVVTHEEEQVLDFQRWETTGVWLETLFGYKELSQDGATNVRIPFEDATRITITVQVCAGDTETTLKWLAQRDTFKNYHKKGLHDQHSTFREERHMSKHYFRDITLSAKKAYISIGYIVFTILGLGPPFRLRLHMVVPEKHYIIEKCVYSSIHRKEPGFSNNAFEGNTFDSHMENKLV